MKTKHLLLLGLVAAFSSCSTAYRTGQTPDDVYYSPAPAQENYVASTSQRDANIYSNQDNEEQEIRRGIQNPEYRSPITLDLGFGYGYNPYGYNPYSYNPYGYNYSPYSFNPYGYKGIYNPYSYDPYGYNSYGYNAYSYSISPYYGNYYGNYYGGYYPPVYVYPGIGNINTNTGPRRVNLGAYSNTGNNRSGSVSNQESMPVRTFSDSRPRTGVGNVIRRVFTPSENRPYTPPQNNRSYSNDNSRSNSNNAPARTFESAPASSNSSSSSGSSGSAPVRTFRR